MFASRRPNCSFPGCYLYTFISTTFQKWWWHCYKPTESWQKAPPENCSGFWRRRVFPVVVVINIIIIIFCEICNNHFSITQKISRQTQNVCRLVVKADGGWRRLTEADGGWTHSTGMGLNGAEESTKQFGLKGNTWFPALKTMIFKSSFPAAEGMRWFNSKALWCGSSQHVQVTGWGTSAFLCCSCGNGHKSCSMRSWSHVMGKQEAGGQHWGWIMLSSSVGEAALPV